MKLNELVNAFGSKVVDDMNRPASPYPSCYTYTCPSDFACTWVYNPWICQDDFACLAGYDCLHLFACNDLFGCCGSFDCPEVYYGTDSC